MTIKRILCLDSYNCCQSPMMMAWFRKVIQNAIDKRRSPNYAVDEGKIIGVTVDSASTYIVMSTTSASENAIACMREHGIDISDHRIKHIGHLDINDFDLIICISHSDIEIIAGKRPRGLILLAEAGRFYNRGSSFEECYVLTEEIHTFVDKIVEIFF